jgi:hypothetical protein
MNKIETDPFVHIIHDDIDLPKNIINKTLELANTFENKKDVRTMCPIKKDAWYYNNIDYFNNIVDFGKEKLWNLYKKLYQLTSDLHYPNELMSPQKVVWIPTIAKVSPGLWHHSIHTDAPWKIMSTIYYITEKGTGTPLYNANKEFVKEIPWKKGRGYSFLPHKQSYHNYGNSLDEDRITLILNLTTLKYYKITEKI